LGEEVFSELEIKIDALIAKVQNLKQEKIRLDGEIEIEKGKNQELETENSSLKEELQELKNTFEDRGKKLDFVTDKIQSLLSKLETVD
jgi:seryl-tRNA synthetase